MVCRPDFPCLVSVHLDAFSTLPEQFFVHKTIGPPKEAIGSGILL